MNKETFENSKQGLPQLGKKELNDLASAYFGGKSKQEATLEQIDQTNPVTRGSTALVYKEETLEEAAQRLYPIELEDDEWDKNKQYRDEWIEGAKWQQERMYSEEEVFKIIASLLHTPKLVEESSWEDIAKWFEQFKKK